MSSYIKLKWVNGRGDRCYTYNTRDLDQEDRRDIKMTKEATNAYRRYMRRKK